MGTTEPKTRSCPACGGTAVRETRPRTIRYKRRSVQIQQPAWWCTDCGEGILDSKDAAVADVAFATLKARVEGVLPPADITRIRKTLWLSQRQAGKILGGGARAFQRYESGSIVVSKPMSNLLALLDHEPALIHQLAARQVHAAEVESKRR
jgi:HTH-type transcriptional regulator/antitoxin MqsA